MLSRQRWILLVLGFSAVVILVVVASSFSQMSSTSSVSDASSSTSKISITQVLVNSTGTGGFLNVTPVTTNASSQAGERVSLNFKVLFDSGEEFNATYMRLSVVSLTLGFSVVTPTDNVRIEPGTLSYLTVVLQTPSNQFSGPVRLQFIAVPPG